MAKDFSGSGIQDAMDLPRSTAARSVSEGERTLVHAEDRALHARMLDGDERAFAEMVERHSGALYRFALARLDGDRELTLETVQTAMTKAIAKLETFRGESSLLTWLCACCRNEILMHRRRLRSGPVRVELDDGARPAVGAPTRVESDPESNLLRRESQRLVHTALDLLSPRYAQALEWKYVDQIPVDEIAARLGLRPKAAESLLTRARNAFRAEYRRVVTHTADEPSTTAPAPGRTP